MRDAPEVKGTLPLEHIRVLDLTRLVPGPFCSMLLGDMGADILAIEAPASRLHSPLQKRTPEEEERLAAYDPRRRNKRSIVLDLKRPEGQKIFRELARDADVVLEGFRPGVVERLGVDYDSVRQINERIVYCSLSGYGQSGPLSSLVGHDINYLSISGALSMFGSADGQPAIPLNVVADMAGGGLHAAYGILLALFARERTGTGQQVDIAMSDGVMAFLTHAAREYFMDGAVPRRGEHRLTGLRPHYNVYECKDDKWISLGSLEPHFFRNLCHLLGLEEFIEDQDNAARYGEMKERLEAAFRTRDRDEWFGAMQEADICAAPVLALDEALQHPHNLQRGMVLELETEAAGKVQQVGISVKLSQTPGSVRQVGTLPGQHTDEVLESLGYGQEEIKTLREERVVA